MYAKLVSWIGPLGLLIALVGLAPQGRACSICLAGDPQFSSQGTSAQEEGRVSVALETRRIEKKSGLLPEEDPEGTGREKSESWRLDLYVAWTPIDRLTLTVDLPYTFNHIKEFTEDEGSSASTHAGVGDLAFTSTIVLWRDRPVLPESWVEGRVFLKTPTGESSKRVNGEKDPHLQVGTGSWDAGLGLAGVHRLEWGAVYGSVFYRWNTEGSLDYRYGDVALANLGSEVGLGHAFHVPALERFTLAGELNYRWAAKDRSEGARWKDSGGSVLYATPMLRVRLPWFEADRAPVLRGSAQLPLTSSWLNGRQTERVVWSVGLAYSF